MQSLSARHVFLAQALAYSGTLPLVAAILSYYLKWPAVDVLHLTRCYLAVIVAFICGTHWAVFLFFSGRCHQNLLISSNGVTLMAWASVIMPDVKVALVMQSLALLYMLMVDYRLREAGVFTPWYYALRNNATAIVVFCIFILEFS